ncbi:MAG: Uma2 family endonuclease [Cyanobacteria bacterium P01_F01_bin.33]
MTVATTSTKTAMSLAEFLAFDDGTDASYELENGELIAMPPESDRNQRITSVLFAYLLRLGIAPECLRMNAELVVSGARATVRVPDLMVLSEELLAALEGATRATVTLEMPPPALVVEVVSPGQRNIDRDYRYKRSQYEARGIQEYWIVDPLAEKVTVFQLQQGLYEGMTFEGEAAIESEQLKALQVGEELTAVKILDAKA